MIFIIIIITVIIINISLQMDVRLPCLLTTLRVLRVGVRANFSLPYPNPPPPQSHGYIASIQNNKTFPGIRSAKMGLEVFKMEKGTPLTNPICDWTEIKWLKILPKIVNGGNNQILICYFASVSLVVLKHLCRLYTKLTYNWLTCLTKSLEITVLK